MGGGGTKEGAVRSTSALELEVRRMRRSAGVKEHDAGSANLERRGGGAKSIVDEGEERDRPTVGSWTDGERGEQGATAVPPSGRPLPASNLQSAQPESCSTFSTLGRCSERRRVEVGEEEGQSSLVDFGSPVDQRENSDGKPSSRSFALLLFGSTQERYLASEEDVEG